MKLQLILIEIFLLIFLFSPSYGQPSSHWINAFSLSENELDDSTTKNELFSRYREDNSYYLLILKEQLNKAIWPTSDLKIIRRLDNRSFIVRIDSKRTFESVLPMSLCLLSTNNLWKLAPDIYKRYSEDLNSEPTRRFIIQYDSDMPIESILMDHGVQYEVVHQYYLTGLIVLELNDREHFDKLIEIPEILSVDIMDHKPVTEQLISKMDIGVHSINRVAKTFPDLNGQGIHLSIKENHFDTSDIDFRNRIIYTGLESGEINTHASVMTTISSGGGNTSPLSRGIAWGSLVSSSDFSSLLPDDPAVYENFGITIQNHSYGIEGIENFYGLDAQAYDQSMVLNPSLVHVFSAGNQGELVDQDGPYAGINGFANLSGSFKMAKNIITVGSMNALGEVSEKSSRGPAHDGRIKPEIVALGETGSSSAAAVVSGVVALLQQYYQSQHTDSLPPSALIKSVLITSADDDGTEGPDFSYGFGKINAYSALNILANKQYVTSKVETEEVIDFRIQVPVEVASFSVTLAWTDPAATALDAMALVNDVDMELISINNGKRLLPWVLNSHASEPALKERAVRRKDRLNNVEQITTGPLEAGNYIIRIIGNHIESGDQEFSFSYQWENTNQLNWTYPIEGDQLVANTEEILRWRSNKTNEPVKIEYSLNEGLDWQLVADNILVSDEYAHWQTPSVLGVAMLRIQTGDSTYYSERFVLYPPIDIEVGFNCMDSALLYWEDNPLSNAYAIYALKDQYMEEVASTTDSFIVIDKSELPYRHFAVGSKLDEFGPVMRGITKDINRQGVGCYINQFRVRIKNSQGELELELGSLYGLSKIYFEKLIGDNYVTVQETHAGKETYYLVNDDNLTQGINRYRIRLKFTNGSNLYSDIREIYYTGKLPYVIFPNPLYNSTVLRVISKEASVPDMHIYDNFGRLILHFPLDDFLTEYVIEGLGQGVYFYQINGDDAPEQSGKIVIVR